MDLLGRVFGHGLDIHAAFGRGDEGHLAGLAVDQDRQVEFAVDIGAVFDIQAVDLLAGRAGLLGHQGLAEHLLGIGQRILGREGDPHAALGIGGQFLELALAASAGVDLAFHHPDRTGQRADSGLCLIEAGDRDALRNRCAKALQDLFGLMFVDVHHTLP